MGVITYILISIVGFFTAVLGKLAADDAKEWIPYWTEKLIDRAVTKLPATDQERFAEEWRADVAEVPGLLGKLYVAIGFNVAAMRMIPALKPAFWVSINTEVSINTKFFKSLKITFDNYEVNINYDRKTRTLLSLIVTILLIVLLFFLIHVLYEQKN